MKTKKIFRISLATSEAYCATVSSLIDFLHQEKSKIPDWRIWKLKKEIGDIHYLDENGEHLTICVLPLLVHENPNKGKYLRVKLK